MKNGVVLYDEKGNILHAHGGCMLKENGYYYWFGENRTGEIRVSCYRSKDFRHWEFRNHVLTCDSKVKSHYIRSDLRLRKEVILEDGTKKERSCNIERPKVLYHPKTKQYVMWMHYENGLNYKDARCAVAVSNKIDGDYTYCGSFNPIGNMSRDCTVFIEEDGTAYFISAARENADLIMYRLTEDYLAIDEQVRILWPGQAREAPVLFKRNGRYYLLSSACTGWSPNQGMYAVSESLTGRWSMLKPLGDSTTYHSQPAFVLPLEGKDGVSWIYVGDRWNGKNYPASTYVFFPLHFDEAGGLTLEYCEEIDWNQYHITEKISY